MKITFEDYKKIQELKRQGFTANQAKKKLPYTQYKIYKYWDMAEEDFFEETNADNSPCSVYREFLMRNSARKIAKSKIVPNAQNTPRPKGLWGVFYSSGYKNKVFVIRGGIAIKGA